MVEEVQQIHLLLQKPPTSKIELPGLWDSKLCAHEAESFDSLRVPLRTYSRGYIHFHIRSIRSEAIQN